MDRAFHRAALAFAGATRGDGRRETSQAQSIRFEEIGFLSLSPETDQSIALNSFSFGAPGAVPEPGPWATMLAGFGALGLALRRGRHLVRAA